MYTFEFKNNEEKNNILKENEHLYLIEERHLIDGKFLVFSDIPTQEVLYKEQNDKLISLKQENANIYYELMMLN